MTDFYGFKGVGPDRDDKTPYPTQCPDCGRWNCPVPFIKQMLDRAMGVGATVRGSIDGASVVGSLALNRGPVRDELVEQLSTMQGGLNAMMQFFLEKGKTYSIPPTYTAIKREEGTLYSYSATFGGLSMDEAHIALWAATKEIQPDYALLASEGKSWMIPIEEWQEATKPEDRKKLVDDALERYGSQEEATYDTAVFSGELPDAGVITHIYEVKTKIGDTLMGERELLHESTITAVTEDDDLPFYMFNQSLWDKPHDVEDATTSYVRVDRRQ